MHRQITGFGVEDLKKMFERSISSDYGKLLEISPVEGLPKIAPCSPDVQIPNVQSYVMDMLVKFELTTMIVHLTHIFIGLSSGLIRMNIGNEFVPAPIPAAGTIKSQAVKLLQCVVDKDSDGFISVMFQKLLQEIDKPLMKHLWICLHEELVKPTQTPSESVESATETEEERQIGLPVSVVKGVMKWEAMDLEYSFKFISDRILSFNINWKGLSAATILPKTIETDYYFEPSQKWIQKFVDGDVSYPFIGNMWTGLRGMVVTMIPAVELKNVVVTDPPPPVVPVNQENKNFTVEYSVKHGENVAIFKVNWQIDVFKAKVNGFNFEYPNPLSPRTLELCAKFQKQLITPDGDQVKDEEEVDTATEK
jgi:hypothetical protein